MKSCNLATRTLDEGGIDESSGSNYSEYVAMLSGNEDLLEKAKLEKKQVVLESEKQAFQRSKGNARGKLKEFTEEIEKNNTFINALERIPDMIAKRREKNTEMEKSLPVLQEIVSATWPKEEELKRLNEDIFTLNKQIQLTIQPKKQEENTNDNELVIGSNEIAARHVPSLKVIVPHTELKKIS